MGDRTCGSSGNRGWYACSGVTVSVPRWIDYLPDGTLSTNAAFSLRSVPGRAGGVCRRPRRSVDDRPGASAPRTLADKRLRSTAWRGRDTRIAGRPAHCARPLARLFTTKNTNTRKLCWRLSFNQQIAHVGAQYVICVAKRGADESQGSVVPKYFSCISCISWFLR